MAKKASPQDWRAVLVDSFCQSGKTAKCFETINAKIIADGAGATPTLVLFVTQANSTASANQVIQRAKNSPIITKVIPKTNVFKSSVMEPDEFVPTKNTMIVDFWNSRNMENMLSFVRNNNRVYKSVIIVVDECDQAAVKGLSERLAFIRRIEKAMRSDSIVKVIFITATVGNLSKSVMQIASNNVIRYRSGVVADIIDKHQFAEPPESYVGASWFLNTPDVYKRIT